MPKLPNPVGRQKEVIYLDPKGHTIVLGTAGSGKTVMSIIRGKYLQNKHCKNGEKTLLMTYNTMLITYMQSYDDSIIPGLDYLSYYKIARSIICNYKGYNINICNDRERNQFINKALFNIKPKYQRPVLNRELYFFVDEIIWLEKFGIRNLIDYESTIRIGRKSSRVIKEDRKIIWEIYVEYQRIRGVELYDCDWNDMPMMLEDLMKDDNTSWMYKHIIIDEGQDFSPSMIRSLAAALPEFGSITFFGDVAQQIYGSRLSWKDAGLKITSPWQFKENYRNTPEIVELALAMYESEYFKDETDLVRPTTTKAKGEKPTLVKFDSFENEYARILRTAKNLGRAQQVAIFVRRRDLVNSLISDLSKDNNLEIINLSGDTKRFSYDPCVMVGTYHAAKGLEFDAVLLPFLSKDRFPDRKAIEEHGEEEANVEAVRLLYVGITRAKSRILLTYSGNITEHLPKNIKLYNFQQENE